MIYKIVQCRSLSILNSFEATTKDFRVVAFSNRKSYSITRALGFTIYNRYKQISKLGMMNR